MKKLIEEVISDLREWEGAARQAAVRSGGGESIKRLGEATAYAHAINHLETILETASQEETRTWNDEASFVSSVGAVIMGTLRLSRYAAESEDDRDIEILTDVAADLLAHISASKTARESGKKSNNIGKRLEMNANRLMGGGCK